MVTKRSAVMAFTAAALSIVTGIAAAGEAQATTFYRTLKFVNGNNICLGLQSKAGTSKGKRPQVQKCNGGAAQLWRLDRVYKGTSDAKIHPGTDTSKCLDGTKSEKLGSGWHLHVAKCNNSTAQRWKYVLVDSGSFFTTQNYKTKLCLGSYKNGTKNGTWVGAFKCTSKNGQILKVA